VCCIYHKPKPVDESSDESSSSDSSDYDSDASDGAKRVGGDKDRDCGHSHGRGHRHGRGKKPEGEKRDPSPNAYEKIPKQKPRDGGSLGK
jgi:protein phosphatase 1 regulatory subunit 11